MTHEETTARVRANVDALVQTLADPRQYPCLKPTLVHGLNVSCLIKQGDTAGHEGYWPNIMCPSCRLLHTALEAKGELERAQLLADTQS